MPTSDCEIGYKCHVNGKDLKTWGSDFSAKVVQTAATSSVQLVFDQKRFASGTLVWPNVVLCAEHSIFNLAPDSIGVLLNYEFTAATAPPGMEKDYRDSTGATLPSWTKGIVMQSAPQAKGVKYLEKSNEFDFAFLLIEWFNVKEQYGGKFVTLPRLPDIPAPGNKFGQ